MKKINFFRIIMMLMIISISANAQTDTIRLKDKRLITSALKPGLKQYLVYFQNPKKNRTLNFSFWTRNGDHYSETYWISKKGHEFLKEEDSFNGGYRYKIKMLGSAPDLLQRFSK